MTIYSAWRHRASFLSIVFVATTISAAGTGLDAQTVSSAKFFAAAPNTAGALNPAGIYPQGQRFGIGLYTIGGNSKAVPGVSNMRRAADHGFTLAGPYYDKNWRDFSSIYSAAAEGMKFTYQIRPPESLFNVSEADRTTALDKLSDAQMAAGVREQVTAILADPVANSTVARWSLGLEELRYWRKSEMRYLKVARDTIRAVEDGRRIARRPFWMYEPNHRDIASLKLTGVHQDIVSKGVYLTSLARGPARSAHAIWSISQIVSAAGSLNTTPQALFQLSEDFKDPKTGTSAAEIRRVIRHDAYLALTMGVKSMNVWSMYENRPNLTTHNDQFLAYASVADELTGDLDLQKVFLFGQRRSDLTFTITQGTRQLSYTDIYGAKFTYDALHVFNAAVGTDRYLFLVNSTEQVMDVKVAGLPSAFVMDDLFAGTTQEMRQSSFTSRLGALGVTALRIRQLVVGAQPRVARSPLPAVPEPTAVALMSIAICGAPMVRPRRRC